MRELWWIYWDLWWIPDIHGGSIWVIAQHGNASTCRLGQEQSGCRVHIERQTHEVRLYGPDENLKVADRLLKDDFFGCFLLKVLSDVAANGRKWMEMATPKYIKICSNSRCFGRNWDETQTYAWWKVWCPHNFWSVSR